MCGNPNVTIMFPASTMLVHGYVWNEGRGISQEIQVYICDLGKGNIGIRGGCRWSGKNDD